MSVSATKAASISGAIHIAPVGTALPTDASASIGSGFSGVGAISDSGLTVSTNMSSKEVKDWSGATVAVLNNGRTETYKFTCLDVDNTNALSLSHADVTGTADSGLVVKGNSKDIPNHAVVIDMITTEGYAKRICLPKAVTTAIGDIKYVDGDPTGFEVTLTALPDENGNCSYTYTKKKESAKA